MAGMKIIQPDNPILRQRAQEVTEFDDDLRRLVKDMLRTLHIASGVGLAAPQVAVSQRVIVVQMPDDEETYGEGSGQLFVVVNPGIIKSSNSMLDGVEGCLSMPGYLGDVSRSDQIVVIGQDEYGKPLRIRARGWLARVFQHEIDHLDGRLFIDIAEEIWRIGDEDERVELEPGELDAWMIRTTG